eukprot:1557408-Prymnesium_polylepis.1
MVRSGSAGVPGARTGAEKLRPRCTATRCKDCKSMLQRMSSSSRVATLPEVATSPNERTRTSDRKSMLQRMSSWSRLTHAPERWQHRMEGHRQRQQHVATNIPDITLLEGSLPDAQDAHQHGDFPMTVQGRNGNVLCETRGIRVPSQAVQLRMVLLVPEI